MAYRTNREHLSDLVRKLGGDPRGKTNAELIDLVEDYVLGGGGGPSEAIVEVGLADEDWAEIFPEPEVEDLDGEVDDDF